MSLVLQREHSLRMLCSSIPGSHFWAGDGSPYYVSPFQGTVRQSMWNQGSGVPFLCICQKHGVTLGRAQSLLALESDLHTFWIALPTCAIKFFVGIWPIFSYGQPNPVANHSKLLIFPPSAFFLLNADSSLRSWLRCHFLSEVFPARPVCPV